MSGLTTEFGFRLPKGYVDREGRVHRDGTMRLATARDELEPQRDPRVRENESYATVILLARVVNTLGTLQHVHITTAVIEDLFVSDFAYLQDLYRIINFQDPAVLEGMELGAPFPPELLEPV